MVKYNYYKKNLCKHNKLNKDVFQFHESPLNSTNVFFREQKKYQHKNNLTFLKKVN